MQYRVYLVHGSTNYLEKLYQIGDLELNIECRYLGKLCINESEILVGN